MHLMNWTLGLYNSGDIDNWHFIDQFIIFSNKTKLGHDISNSSSFSNNQQALGQSIVCFLQLVVCAEIYLDCEQFKAILLTSKNTSSYMWPRS